MPNVARTFGDTTSNAELLREFTARFRRTEWPGTRVPAVYFDPRSLAAEPAERASLHAKCVVVDRRVAFVSSANFTDAAQNRNIEVGALIRFEAFARKLDEHFRSLAAKRLLKRLPTEA